MDPDGGRVRGCAKHPCMLVLILLLLPWQEKQGLLPRYYPASRPTRGVKRALFEALGTRWKSTVKYRVNERMVGTFFCRSGIENLP